MPDRCATCATYGHFCIDTPEHVLRFHTDRHFTKDNFIALYDRVDALEASIESLREMVHTMDKEVFEHVRDLEAWKEQVEEALDYLDTRRSTVRLPRRAR